MPTHNLQLNSIAFADTTISNNPQIRNWDLGFKLLGQPVDNPRSENFNISPGTSKNVFDGSRSTALDGTSAFDISQPYPAYPGTYRFTNSGGTNPAFRTNRLLGADVTTQITVTVNGPIMTLTQSGGTAINTSSVAIGDILNIGPGAGLSFPNQGQWTIIAKTSTSLTVQNLNGVAETAIILDPTQFIAFSNGGNNSNQTQIGDKVIIGAGFSQVTCGTYIISNITPSYFEIATSYPNGLPIESGVIPGVAGLVFYGAAKQFVLVAAQQKCSVQVNADSSDNNLVEPVEIDNPERPGLFIKQGTVYSLTIHNLSLETLSVIVATAE